MKHVKKVFAFAMTLVMALALVAPALAATIDVQNVVEGETYTAYKILNYRDNGQTGDDRNVSYYLTKAQYESNLGSILESAGFEFTASSDGTEYFVSNTNALKTSGVSAVAENLRDVVSGETNPLDTVALKKYVTTGAKTSDGTGTEAVFDANMEAGYYFVTTTTGTLCALHEDGDIETVVEKNTIPGIDKKQKRVSDPSYVDENLNLNVGDTVNYQVVITDGTGTANAITMVDTMTSGLTYTAGSIKINGNAVADDAATSNWTVTVDGRVITIVFSAAYVESLDAGDSITVTYDATINKDAVVNSATGNENKAGLDYSAQHTEDKVYVETYDFLVKKTDGTNFLDGAEFKLYDAATGGNQIVLTKDDTGYYVDASGSANTTIDINSADGCNVRGLASGTYYLEEVVVPGGYNKLSAREPVSITAGQTAAVEITVMNQAGAEMPSTGGIGTTIFYVVGGVMVAGAAIFLLTKRRMAGTEE